MVKSVGFDPVPETRSRYAVRFVLLAWKDALLRMFVMDGRTSRAAFLVSIVPVILIWFGVLYFGIVTTQKYKLLDSVPYMLILILPFVAGATLVFRRMHDSGSKAFGASDAFLGFFNPFSSLMWLAKLVRQGDSGDNKYGPPHVLIPKNEEERSHDPKQIG